MTRRFFIFIFYFFTPRYCKFFSFFLLLIVNSDSNIILTFVLAWQEELANAIVAHEMGDAEVLVERRSQKEFLRDCLLAQGGVKTPGAELDDLLARYYY